MAFWPSRAAAGAGRHDAAGNGPQSEEFVLLWRGRAQMWKEEEHGTEAVSMNRFKEAHHRR
ncbi:MAG: hypothetical protein IPM76_08005 [Chloroflexi bacterium]|nr:hypothetical protein [Chloroflexota bacterium]